MGGADMTMIENPHIDLTTLKNVIDFELVYYDDDDTFFARPEVARPATSVDWNGEFWLRVDPETGEIVGVEINDFEAVFLKKYPGLAQAWHEVKPLCHRRKTAKYEDESWESFLRIIYEFIVQFLREKPTQINLGIA
jgi:hypothetical protein